MTLKDKRQACMRTCDSKPLCSASSSEIKQRRAACNMVAQSALPGSHPCLASAAGAADGLLGEVAVLIVAEVGLLLHTLVTAFGIFCLVMGTSMMFPTLRAPASIVRPVQFAEAQSQGSGAEGLSHALCLKSQRSLQQLSIVHATFDRLSECKPIIDMNISTYM